MSQPSRTVPLGTRQLLGFATLVAAVATAGSLYFSLGVGLTPCRLCWYQRILMYPLVVVLGVAAFERRAEVARTVLPLAVLGGSISAYHSWLQVSQSSCGLGAVSCSAVVYRVVGFSIPNLALMAFSLVVASVGLAWWQRG
ncbi:disulfide bond formation protein B [Halomicroarcula limicola]|uniref:Disulfide bond formation protein B n=1 Tax=Haloarcula limicola TaxID=1429915 RepID=A0A8J8C7K0_9EURY|nr:disulfide bond formation protein B [Halomicroarcula limicola]MBV0923635.1 disulfide bond formation protein B [Halomicroarcula limicola]